MSPSSVSSVGFWSLEAIVGVWVVLVGVWVVLVGVSGVASGDWVGFWAAGVVGDGWLSSDTCRSVRKRKLRK